MKRKLDEIRVGTKLLAPTKQNGWNQTIKLLESTLHWMRTAPPEQFKGVKITLKFERKQPRHKLPLWYEKVALALYRASRCEGKTRDEARAIVNRRMKINLTTAALIGIEHRDRNPKKR